MAQPGIMQTPEGKTVGKHDGLMFYTLGQRQGLHIGGVKHANEAPWYVLAKDIKNNILIVGQGHDHPLLFKNKLIKKRLEKELQTSRFFKKELHSLRRKKLKIRNKNVTIKILSYFSRKQ